MWLKERGGQRAFFTDGGKFAFTSEVPTLIYAFDVQGSLGSASSSAPASVPASASAISYPTTSPVLSTFRRPSTAKNQSVNVKVIQAKMTKIKGRPNFINISLEYVEVTEATANVASLSSTVQKKWGDDHVLVGADGLLLEESSATQGSASVNVLSKALVRVVSQLILYSYPLWLGHTNLITCFSGPPAFSFF